MCSTITGRLSAVGLVLPILAVLAFTSPPRALAQQSADGMGEVTFTRDIAPILQRSCVRCHRPGGVAPMSLVEYEDVQPHAMRIMRRTGIRDRMGAMPPWYVEKDIGIQHYKDDPSLSTAEITAIASWARGGTPMGNPADMPTALVFDDKPGWTLGEPDLIVSTEEFLVKGEASDWWGDIQSVPTGLTEDRYVASVEIREINDVGESGSTDRETVGGLYVFHHMVYSTRVLDDPDVRRVSWPVHEVGRNADIFDPEGALSSGPVRASFRTRPTCIRTGPIPELISRSASGSIRGITSGSTGRRTSSSAAARTSTSRPERRTRSCTRTPCFNSPRRS